jgi:hypothetical protein
MVEAGEEVTTETEWDVKATLTLVGRERVTEIKNHSDCREHTVLVVYKTSCDTIYFAHGLKRMERVGFKAYRGRHLPRFLPA